MKMKNLKSKIQNLTSSLALCVLLTFVACEPQLIDDPIPLVAFNDVVISLGLPEYIKLRVDGGWYEIPRAGIRGIIVYRVNSTTFRAYEKNCSFHPNEAGATVNVDVSNLFLRDASCGSQFNFENGQPSGGPAWRPLRQYAVEFQTNTVTITDDVIN